MLGSGRTESCHMEPWATSNTLLQETILHQLIDSALLYLLYSDKILGRTHTSYKYTNATISPRVVHLIAEWKGEEEPHTTLIYSGDNASLHIILFHSYPPFFSLSFSIY